MSSSPIAQALQNIAEEKGLEYEVVLGTLEVALAAAYRKDFGTKEQNIVINYDPETGAMKIFDVKEVVEDQELPDEEDDAPMEPQYDENGEEIKRFNPKTEIMLTQAKEEKPDAEIGDIIKRALPIHEDFGRMAAQTAKQVITQKIREAERNAIYEEFKDYEGTVVMGAIGRREPRHVLVDIGKATGILPYDEQVPGEMYRTGARMKMYVVSVQMTTKGPEIVLSRAHTELVKEVFTNEIPEIASDIVEIKGIAREAGNRSKVAVYAEDESIDPIGSCIGQRGTRIQTIIAELGGEKVDLIQWSEDPKEYIIQALAPAVVQDVEFDEEKKIANVIVGQDQFSLAIGRGGQNVRLASKLTGWTINVLDENGATAQEVREQQQALENENAEHAVPEIEAEADSSTEELSEATEPEGIDESKEAEEDIVETEAEDAVDEAEEAISENVVENSEDDVKEDTAQTDEESSTEDSEEETKQIN